MPDFGVVVFTAPPIDPDTIFYIRPMGAITGGHAILTDHIYIHARGPGDARFVEDTKGKGPL